MREAPQTIQEFGMRTKGTRTIQRFRTSTSRTPRWTRQRASTPRRRWLTSVQYAERNSIPAISSTGTYGKWATGGEGHLPQESDATSFR